MNIMKLKSRHIFLAIFIISAFCGTMASGAGKGSVKRVIGQMTLKEKVCQMIFIQPETLASPSDTENLGVTQLSVEMSDFFREYPVGGFCLFPRNITNPEQLVRFTADLHSLSPSPLLCVDEEGGRVARIANNDAFGLERFESMTALASGNDRKKVRRASNYIGSYVRKFGFDVDFAPVADVNTNPGNIVIGPRAFSDNPKIAATMVKAYLRGLKQAGITGCLKHFPGHGDTLNDTHTGYASSQKTWDEMNGCEMLPFKAGIASGAEIIMTAHIAAPNVTGTDKPSTLSSVILQEKLRESLGYKGIIITDAMVMGAISLHYSSAEAAVEAIKAGADIILMPKDLIEAVDGIVSAVEKGEIDEKRIDESVCRIMRLKHKKGL